MTSRIKYLTNPAPVSSAYLTSWGYYFTGKPVGNFTNATTLLTSTLVKADQTKPHTFAKMSQMGPVRRDDNELTTIEPVTVHFETPLDLFLTSKESEDETEPELTIGAGTESDEDEDEVEDEDEEMTPPPPPPPKLTKSRPDDSESESETDEQLARRLHQEMNGRSSRRKSS